MALLREKYEELGPGEVSALLGRSLSSVMHKAVAEGLKPSLGRGWKPEEVEVIRKHYGELGPSGVGAMLGKSPTAVMHKASNLGIRTAIRRPWTADDLRVLTWDWGTYTIAHIAKKLNRTEKAVFTKAKKLGLGIGCPPGWVRVVEAARRIGVDRETLLRTLKAAGVPVKKSWSTPVENRRFHFPVVEYDLAVEAWERRASMYPVNVIADHCGVSRTYMRTLLLRAGKKPPPKNSVWYLTVEEAFAVVRAWVKLREETRIAGPRPRVTLAELDRREAALKSG